VGSLFTAHLAVSPDTMRDVLHAAHLLQVTHCCIDTCCKTVMLLLILLLPLLPSCVMSILLPYGSVGLVLHQHHSTRSITDSWPTASTA
jgi:hypothetical protein